MPRQARLRPAARTAMVLGLWSAAALGSPSPANASASIAGLDEPTAETSESGGWTPLVGGCLGVLFGGAIALWQIRGMRNRD